MATVAERPHSPQGDSGRITQPFEFPPQSKLTFVTVRGLDNAIPSLEDIRGITQDLLFDVQVDWERFSYEPLHLLTEGSPQATVPSLARELLEQIRDEWYSCNSAYIVLCASDIGALVVKEALVLAATDPLYQNDHLLSKTCLVAFFGSPHRTKTTAEMVSIIYSLLQTFHQDESRSRMSPRHLTELACYYVDLASRFERAQKPYQVISCFQQCGPQSSHTQIVPESCARTFAANEIALGLDRSHTQLHAGIGYKEEEFWRVQFEDACTRKLTVYQELTRVLYPGFPPKPPRSRQTCRNLAEGILNRDDVQKWFVSNALARRQSFLHLTRPHFPVRPDVLGHAIALALHTRISKNVLFQPITLYLDAEKLEANNSDIRAVSEAYGLLCAGLLDQQPNLAMHLWDVNVSELTYTKEQRLFSALSKQLRGLFIKLVSCQSTSREVYMIINLTSWSTLVHDVLNTLSDVVNSTDSQLTVVLLTAPANQGDSTVSCRIPVSFAASFCTQILDGMDITDALNQDIRDWLVAGNISLSVPLCNEAGSEAFRRLKDTASWPEAEQFLIYLEQVSDHANSPISSLSLERSSASRLSKAILIHGNWLLVALLWIYNANRPLTLDELDEAVSFDLSVGPELMSALLSDAHPAPAQEIQAVRKSETQNLRFTVATDVIRAIPGAVVIDDGRVFPVDENTRQYFADPINLKPIAACSPSDYLALSCLLRIEHEHLKDAHSNPDESIEVNRAHPTGMTEYAFASWAEHFLTSLPPDTVSQERQNDTLYGDVNLALESLATKFLNTSAKVERWLKFVKVPVAEWSNPEVMYEVAVDCNVFPTSLRSELNISMRQAAYLATRLLTRLDTWNSDYDSLLLRAVNDDDNFLWNALCHSRRQTNQAFQAEAIAQALLTASPQMKDQLDETLRGVFPLLDANMTLYCIASQDPAIVGLIDSIPVKRGHVEYLLRVAIQLGDLPLLEKLLECVDNHGNKKNHTEGRLLSGIKPILVAAGSGQTNVLQNLLQIDAPMNIQTESGLSPVMLASVNGFADIVDLLLKKEVIDINAQSRITGDSALHLSSRSGFFKTVDILLGHKADPCLANSNGDLPLHLALAYGHLEVAERLLESMPDHLSCERTALLLTRKSSLRPESVDYDLDIDSDWSDTESDSDSMSDSVHTSDRDTSDIVAEGQTICPFNIFNSSRTTAFILAAHQGSVSICDKMLAKHADPKLVDVADMSALDHAAQEGSMDLIDLLLKYQPDIITQCKPPRTALYHAAKVGHSHVAQKLLDYNNDLVNQLDEDDELLPLHKAISLGYSKVMDVIIKGCLKVGVTHPGLATGLLYATKERNISAMKCLLDHGVDINAVDECKNTALHFAAYRDYVHQVELLVMRKAQLDHPDNEGFTPLMDATRNNSLSSLKVLINAGANLEATKDNGSSALDLAIEYERMECGKLLLGKLLRCNPDWINPSNRDPRPYLQFILLDSSGTDLATSILDVVVGKNLEKSQSSSVKGFISSLLWDRWLTVLEFFWTHWNASALQLGDYGTALHYAVMRHQTSVVKTILNHPKHSIDVNYKSGAYGTALQAIIMLQPRAGIASAFLNMVEMLLEHQADPRMAGKAMAYVLQSAVFNRRRELAISLLNKLQPKDILRRGGEHGTVLQALLAGPQRNDDVVEELLDLLLETHGESVMRTAEGCNEGITALHRAAEYASLRVVQHLMKLNDKLDVKIDINQADFVGRLPVHYAVWSIKDRWNIIQAIDPELKTLWKHDRLQMTVLHMAAKGGDTRVFEHILEAARVAKLDIGKLVNERDIDGWTPLHWACRSPHNNRMIGFLIENKADVEARTFQNWLPWHVALYHNMDYLRPEDGLDEDEDSKDPGSDSDAQGRLPTEPAQAVPNCVCDGCLSKLFGETWHCTTCTEEHILAEFDLCFKCYPHKDKIHPSGHDFEQLGEDWYWVLRQKRAALFTDVE